LATEAGFEEGDKGVIQEVLNPHREKLAITELTSTEIK
jgi:hypothetical protein